MESAFKLQLKAESGSASEKFVLDKLEKLGRKKATLEKSLVDMEELNNNVISLDEVRQDLEDRVFKITKGWSKLPAAQKRRALRRLVEKLAVGPKGLDIYYYNCASQLAGTSGGFSEEVEKSAKVLKTQIFVNGLRDCKGNP